MRDQVVKVEPVGKGTDYEPGWVTVDPVRGLDIALPRPVKRPPITLNYVDITHLIGSAKRGQIFLNVYDDTHTIKAADGITDQPERIGEIWSDQNGTWWVNCWLDDSHPLHWHRNGELAKAAFQRHVRRFHKVGE